VWICVTVTQFIDSYFFIDLSLFSILLQELFSFIFLFSSTAFPNDKTPTILNRSRWARIEQWPDITESFSEESDKIGRRFIKILETWQFRLSFNIIKHVFFLFGPNKILCRFYEFLINFGLAQKRNHKITLLAVNNAFFYRFLWLSTFFEGSLLIFWFLLHFENFCKFSIFHGLFFFLTFDPRNKAVRDTLNFWFFL
jgi:hypothetical protein